MINRNPYKVYRGLFGRQARRRCPHSDLQAIYGDAIIHLTLDGFRLYCWQCRQMIDGPVSLADNRRKEIDDRSYISGAVAEAS